MMEINVISSLCSFGAVSGVFTMQHQWLNVLETSATFCNIFPHSEQHFVLQDNNKFPRYYLEDGTVSMSEPRIENSGIVQGQLFQEGKAIETKTHIGDAAI